MLAVDHLIYATPDPAAYAARLLDEHGLASASGGRHSGHGTGNVIVPLGTAYLELVTVHEPDIAETSPFGRWILKNVEAGGGPIGWALRTDDIETFVARHGVGAAPMARELPTGHLLSWRLTGLDRAIERPPLPIVLEWDVPEPDRPYRVPVEHRASPDGFSSIRLGGDPDVLREWLGEIPSEVGFTTSEPGVLGATMRVDGRDVDI